MNCILCSRNGFKDTCLYFFYKAKLSYLSLLYNKMRQQWPSKGLLKCINFNISFHFHMILYPFHMVHWYCVMWHWFYILWHWYCIMWHWCYIMWYHHCILWYHLGGFQTSNRCWLVMNADGGIKPNTDILRHRSHLYWH